jgi:hypothetical protein
VHVHAERLTKKRNLGGYRLTAVARASLWRNEPRPDHPPVIEEAPHSEDIDTSLRALEHGVGDPCAGHAKSARM